MRVQVGELLPPSAVRELRQGLRANYFVWPFIVVQLFVILAVVGQYAQMSGWIDIPEHGFQWVHWVVFAVVLPMTHFNALRQELGQGRNIELLLLSNLTRWQVVLGKWFTGCLLSNLLLISLLPYWLVRYLLGGTSDLASELELLFLLVAANCAMNAVVIGASGSRNHIVRFLSIALSAGCGYLAGLGTAVGTRQIPVLGVVAVVMAVAMVVILNLQLGRARLRLFENPLDPPSSSLIYVLIVCSPILIGIAAGVTLGKGGWIMTVLLAILGAMIDPGPGKKHRRWAHA